jgi:nitrate/nitrite-specific signal transduction histidine kinase
MIEDLKRHRSILEETNKILEIKVKARTQELENLTAHLEDTVKERTKELEKKLQELETFHRVAVGRELKMIQLKKEIERLKAELKKYKDKAP